MGIRLPPRHHVTSRLGGGGIIGHPVQAADLLTRTSPSKAGSQLLSQTSSSGLGSQTLSQTKSASMGDLRLTFTASELHCRREATASRTAERLQSLDVTQPVGAPRAPVGVLPGSICKSQRLRTCPGNACSVARRMLRIQQAGTAGAGNPPGDIEGVSYSMVATGLKGMGMTNPSAQRKAAKEKEQGSPFFLARHPEGQSVGAVQGSPSLNRTSSRQLSDALAGRAISQSFTSTLQDHLFKEIEEAAAEQLAVPPELEEQYPAGSAGAPSPNAWKRVLNRPDSVGASYSGRMRDIAARAAYQSA